MTGEDLEARVSELEDLLDAALGQSQQALQRVSDLEDEVEDLRAENRNLRAQLDQLSDNQEMFREVRRNTADTREEQAAICIQTLAERARSDVNSRAEMDATGAMNALGGAVHRTNCYEVLKTAARLVDGDVLRYRRESRSSAKNSRLILDLDADGDLPAQVAGVDLRPDVDVDVEVSSS